MKKNIKKLWVKALRSREYKQGQGCLRDKDEYCCLGVLCDLHNKESKENNWEEVGFYSDYLGNTDLLPYKVMNWAGLIEDNPTVSVNKKSIDLAKLNDGASGTIVNRKRKTFKQIANIIEKNL